VGHQGACGVRTQVMHNAENFVRHGACLNADILLLHLFHQVWMHDQVKPMANSLGAQQDSIEELRVRTHVSLTSVEVQLEAIAKLHFDKHDLVKEIIDTWVVVFFIYHIESRDQVGHGVSCDDVVELGLDVASAEHLETAND